jgi:CheY-like chemotaxis protein
MLRHPRLVQCLDAGVELGHPFLVLEFIPGGEVLAMRRRYPDGLPREVLLGIAADAADGLRALHAAGMCHRDVKPANLLIDADGRIRLADFGLIALDAGDQFANASAVGTPNYMAPEVLGGAGAGRQADIYGLGATLYHLVTGVPPHDADTIDALIHAVLHKPFPDPREAAAWLDEDVGAVIARMGEKLPGRRYASIDEVADDLERLSRRSQPINAMLAAGGEAPAPAWSAYIHHEGAPDRDLAEHLADLLPDELRPVEIRALPGALGAGHPLLAIYDAGTWSDAVIAWAVWISRQTPGAGLVVLVRRADADDLQRLREAVRCLAIPCDGLRLAEIGERVVGHLSTASEGPARPPGVPVQPAFADVALTRTVVLANRLDCADPQDVERYARACAGLASQLHGDRQVFARNLALAMSRYVRESADCDRENVRRLLARASRMLERSHRGLDLRWKRLEAVVVDDHPVGCLAIAAALRRHGVDCRTCNGAEAALAEVSRSVPHILISDVAMPERNGFQLMEDMRRMLAGSSCPVLFVTGVDGLAGFLAGSSRPDCDIMAKPARSGEILLRSLLLIGETHLGRTAG